MTRKQDSAKEQVWKRTLIETVKEEHFLRPLVEQIVQRILEAEMDETLGAEKRSSITRARGGSSVAENLLPRRVECADALGNGVRGLGWQLRIQRETEDFPGNSLRGRKRTRAAAQVGVGGLEVDGRWIVYACANAFCS